MLFNTALEDLESFEELAGVHLRATLCEIPYVHLQGLVHLCLCERQNRLTMDKVKRLMCSGNLVAVASAFGYSHRI